MCKGRWQDSSLADRDSKQVPPEFVRPTYLVWNKIFSFPIHKNSFASSLVAPRRLQYIGYKVQSSLFTHHDSIYRSGGTAPHILNLGNRRRWVVNFTPRSLYRRGKGARFTIKLLKPTGHVMHQQFNIQHCTFCPHCIYVFCIYLRTNSHLCHLQHKLIGCYNRDEKCLLRGTNWVFN